MSAERTHKFDLARLHRLDRPERHAELRPAELLGAHGVGAGMTVVDIGCGTGFFTLPAAALVGEAGRVYALDIAPEMLDHLRDRRPPAQVETILSEEDHFPILDGVVQVAVLSCVLHEARDPERFLREVGRILVPGARVLCLEWKRQAEERGPPVEHRIASEEVERLFRCTGLSVASNRHYTASHYLIVADAPGNGGRGAE